MTFSEVALAITFSDASHFSISFCPFISHVQNTYPLILTAIYIFTLSVCYLCESVRQCVSVAMGRHRSLSQAVFGHIESCSSVSTQAFGLCVISTIPSLFSSRFYVLPSLYIQHVEIQRHTNNTYTQLTFNFIFLYQCFLFFFSSSHIYFYFLNIFIYLLKKKNFLT